jgi:hypothetical protein
MAVGRKSHVTVEDVARVRVHLAAVEALLEACLKR